MYNVHNFTKGHVLTAEELNEMDSQIEHNALDISEFNQNLVDSRIKTLNLTKTDNKIVLKIGDTIISETAIPGADTTIECTGIEITGWTGSSQSDEEMSIEVGNSVKLNYSVTPVSTTQTVRFYATGDCVRVDAEGNVTATAIGEGTITAHCGNKTATIQVSTYSMEDAHWVCASNIQLADSFNTTPAIKCVGITTWNNAPNRLCCTLTEDDGGIFVKAGQYVTVSPEPGFAVHQVFGIEIDGDIVWGTTWLGSGCPGPASLRTLFSIDTGLNYTDFGVARTFRVENDCWLAMKICKNMVTNLTDDDLADFVDNKRISIKISASGVI